MLNKAVTLYLLVFLFVRRRDDIVAGEDGVSEKEDMETDGVRQGASCYLWVEQQRLIEYCRFYRGTVTRATPALGSGRIRGQEEWGGWRGMKGLESGEWKTIRTKQISTEVTATLARGFFFFRIFISPRAVYSSEPSTWTAGSFHSTVYQRTSPIVLISVLWWLVSFRAPPTNNTTA